MIGDCPAPSTASRPLAPSIRTCRHGRPSAGFTLFELIVVIAVGGVLTAWTAHTILLGTRVSQSVAATTRGMNATRDVLSWMERDVTEARAARISASAGTTRLIIERPASEDVTYTYRHGILERSDVELADGIESLTWTLLDAAGAATDDADAAVGVLVSLAMATTGAGMAGQRFLSLGLRTFPYADMRDSIR